MTSRRTGTKHNGIAGSSQLKLGDVRLHYRDWGGDGPPLLLLPGLGDTAFIFDEFAGHFVERYRVLGLTRRGHGGSSVPRTGYDPKTLAGDIARFLDALEVPSVTLIGHSMAGNEMTWFASTYPDRVSGLIYLDAAYDRSGMKERMGQDPVLAVPRPTPNTLDELRQAGRNFFGFWSEALEANLRARLETDAQGRPRITRPYVNRAITDAHNDVVPDYRHIAVPALAVYALFGEEHWALPENADDLLRQRAARFMREVMIPWQRRSIEQFRAHARQGTVLELPGAHHYLFFFLHRKPVLRAIDTFLSKLPDGRRRG